MTSLPTVSLLNVRNAGPVHAYHDRNKQNYLNIINRHYPVRSVDVTLPVVGKLCAPEAVAAVLEAGGPFVFNDLDYAMLLRTYVHADAGLRERLLRFLQTTNYLAYFCEVFCNNRLQTVGSDACDHLFATTFFGRAKRLLVSNTRNIEYLRSAGIAENYLYYPPYGLSRINGICPLRRSAAQHIDVLIYGNMHPSFTHRVALTDAVVQLCIAKRWIYCVTTGLYEDKNALLSQTKIVVHAPSHDGVETFPWAKAAELMAKKVFFLIEDNEELRQQRLDTTVAFYNRGDPGDLLAKIDWHLANAASRDECCEKCYQYLASHYDMDADLPRILGEAFDQRQ